MSVEILEPITPDPKKLRRTAWILVAIMILGGILILKAYNQRTKQTANDDRPSFVTQISETKDLSFMQQDGKVTDLISLKGKVLVVQSLVKSQPDSLSKAVMERLSGRYAGRDDIVLVTLLLDPGPAETLRAELADLAINLGASLPHWVVASNDRPTVHRFIKNEFKANMFPQEKDGKWLYDRSIVLIDRNRHVRRAVIPQKRGGSAYVTAFDFEQAEDWDAKGIQTGTPLSNVTQMEVLLEDTIEILLAETSKP